MFQSGNNFVFFVSNFNLSFDNEIHPVCNFTFQDDVLKLRVGNHFEFSNQRVKRARAVFRKQLPIFNQSFQRILSNVISHADWQFIEYGFLVNTF